MIDRSISRRDFHSACLGALASMAMPPAISMQSHDGFAGLAPTLRCIAYFHSVSAAASDVLCKTLPADSRCRYLICPQAIDGDLATCGGPFRTVAHFAVYRQRRWTSATDAQLLATARTFRSRAFAGNVCPDYFAFDNLPAQACDDPELRKSTATLCRYIHDADDGLPAWRGILLMTHRTIRAEWQGDSSEIERFWGAIRETCDLVVGESLLPIQAHEFATPAVPRWLGEYCAMQSSFVGKTPTNWGGSMTAASARESFIEYVDRKVEAALQGTQGQLSIGFAPMGHSDATMDATSIIASRLSTKIRQILSA